MENDIGVSSSILSYFILSSLTTTQALHAKNRFYMLKMNIKMDSKMDMKMDLKMDMKMNMYFQNELAFPYCFEA